ncbi:MAG: SET domain-containing protein-lysine N-methyltransferase [Chlamydiota bacterium]|nr:SET domain-containing protein-lysine N-methyltransferase [Chlamydiota bacterium]
MFDAHFQLATSIRYLKEIEIPPFLQQTFKRAWKPFYSNYSSHLSTTRKKQFQQFAETVARHPYDQKYCHRVMIDAISQQVGYGVFATVDIPPYSILHQYSGILVRERDANPHSDSLFAFSKFSGFCIDAAEAGNWTRFMNHAPLGHPAQNVIVWEYYRPAGPMIIFTAGSQGISQGSQLLYSYGDDYWKKKGPYCSFSP